MPWFGWIAFVVSVLILLVADLLILHKRPHAVGFREAAAESAGWIALGLGFAGVVAWAYGGHAAGAYLTGYIVEKSLSVDNIFVFILIFKYFRVPAAYQHRVLFYGIFGALVFRGIFIGLGTVLLAKFSWIAFLFGAILLYSAWHFATHDNAEVHPEHNPVLRWMRRHVRMSKDYDGTHLCTRVDGRWAATPLAAVLVVVETTDIVFAVDSIPAIFGVTRDPFLVFSSNAMALLGLRALYFVLADVMDRFRYLTHGLAAVLGLIGVKLIYEELVNQHGKGNVDWFPHALVWHVPHWLPLVVVALILLGSIGASLVSTRREDAAGEA